MKHHKRYTRQINNLKIKLNSEHSRWQVITPDKHVLEEFELQEHAERFAAMIWDFTTRPRSAVL